MTSLLLTLGNGALNVLKRDTLTDSLSITQTIYVYNPRFINISNAKKLICVTGYDLTFYQIDSISGQLNYFSSFHDSISSKYYGKKYIDIYSKYLYACPYTDSVYIFQLDFTLSVPSIIGEKVKISIYPNPFSYQTTLQTTALLDNATINLVNCFGKTVKQINNISGHTITFNRDNLPSGLYFVRLTQGNRTIYSNKLIIVD